MLTRDLYNNRRDDIPDEFYLSLPLDCDEVGCNHPIEISEVLTRVHCSNPKCPSKIIKRIGAMMNLMGVKDFGEARVRKFVETYGVNNPLAIFAYEPEVDGVLGNGISLDLSLHIASQVQERNNFTLSEYIRVANLPGVQTSALSLFGEYDSLYDAYDRIESGGVSYVMSKLSIAESDELSVRAMQVYDSLTYYKQDLFDFIEYVNIIPVNTGEIINIVALCSDQVGHPFATKADFYAKVNNLSSRVHVDFLGAYKNNIEYLVWVGADGTPARLTGKVKKAQAYNEKCGYENIKIVTAVQFLDIVKEML